MARNFFRKIGIVPNPSYGEMPETNVQMMHEPIAQMYPGSNDQVMAGTNTQMYPGMHEHIIPGTNVQMYPGKNGQMMPGENPQMMPGSNDQMIARTHAQTVAGANEEMIPGTHTQELPGTNEQMMPGTHTQMTAGTNAQMIPGTMPESNTQMIPETIPEFNTQMIPGTIPEFNTQMIPGTMPESNTQLIPGITDQIMSGTNAQIIPEENVQAMSSAKAQVMVSDISHVKYNQNPQEMACRNLQSTESIQMQSKNTQFASAGTQDSKNNQHASIPPNKANQRAQYNQETTENDYEPPRRFHSAYTPVGARSKTSQILGIGCRLLWILYLLTAGLYLLTDGFRQVTKVLFHSVGITMILVGVAFLIGAFYLGYKTIGRHCIPVVAMPQANYSYQHFNESCYRQPRKQGLQNPVTYGEHIALQQVPVKIGMDKSDCPSSQHMVSPNIINQQQMESDLAPAGDQVYLSDKVDQQIFPYDNASQYISPSGKQLEPSPNPVDQQLAIYPKQNDQQLVLSPNPGHQQAGSPAALSPLRLKSSSCSREVRTSTPSEHMALNLSPSEEQESPPSHEFSKLLVNQKSP